MHKIEITDPVRLRAAIEFADEQGCLEQFGTDLCRLLQVLTADMVQYPGADGSNIGPSEGRYIAEITYDFAPHSFGFAIWNLTKPNAEKSRDTLTLNGGWIYSGPGCRSDGSFPSLTVSLDDVSGQPRPKHKWRCHT